MTFCLLWDSSVKPFCEKSSRDKPRNYKVNINIKLVKVKLAIYLMNHRCLESAGRWKRNYLLSVIHPLMPRIISSIWSMIMEHVLQLGWPPWRFPEIIIVRHFGNSCISDKILLGAMRNLARKPGLYRRIQEMQVMLQKGLWIGLSKHVRFSFP